MRPSLRVSALSVLFGGLALLTVGCVPPVDLSLPSPSTVEEFYEYSGGLAAHLNGNVAQVTVTVDQDEFRRGGATWARAFPYIFLFSSATQALLQEYPGLGGVRVIVRYGDGTIVSQALLEQGTMNPGEWSRAIAIAGLARAEGTERPGYMRDLVLWGEDHTTFDYNPAYIPPR